MDKTDTKFILQIRPFQYWRIELSVKADTTDCGTANNLRSILEETLLFEKTPNPFRESIVVTEQQMMPQRLQLNRATCQSPTTDSKRSHADSITQRARSVSDETPRRLGSPHSHQMTAPKTTTSSFPVSDVALAEKLVSVPGREGFSYAMAGADRAAIENNNQHQGNRKRYYRQTAFLPSIVLFLCALFVRAALLSLKLCAISLRQIISHIFSLRKQGGKQNKQITKQRHL